MNASSRLSVPSPVTRAALERLVEPLRRQLSPENAALLDLLVTVAATGATASALPEPGAPTHDLGAPPGLAPLLGAKCWEELRVTVVDGHTLRIGCGRHAVRRTYRDLGLHAANSREPTRKWAMLLAICSGHGTFRWTDFGSARAVSQAVSVLRRKLQDAFGLTGDPFHEWDRGWRARFFASSEIG